MVRGKENSLSYEPASTADRRFTAAQAVLVAMLAVACFFGITVLWRRPFAPPNAPLYYPTTVGAVPALYEIREAVLRFDADNEGRLPRDLSEVAPLLPAPRQPTPVTAKALLPHVALISPNDSSLDVGAGRFVLAVHLLAAGDLTSDVTLVIGETGFGYKELYSDRQITGAFGAARLGQLKDSACQLP